MNTAFVLALAGWATCFAVAGVLFNHRGKKGLGFYLLRNALPVVVSFSAVATAYTIAFFFIFASYDPTSETTIRQLYDLPTELGQLRDALERFSIPSYWYLIAIVFLYFLSIFDIPDNIIQNHPALAWATTSIPRLTAAIRRFRITHRYVVTTLLFAAAFTFFPRVESGFLERVKMPQIEQHGKQLAHNEVQRLAALQVKVASTIAHAIVRVTLVRTIDGLPPSYFAGLALTDFRRFQHHLCPPAQDRWAVEFDAGEACADTRPPRESQRRSLELLVSQASYTVNGDEIALSEQAVANAGSDIADHVIIFPFDLVASGAVSNDDQFGVDAATSTPPYYSEPRTWADVVRYNTTFESSNSAIEALSPPPSPRRSDAWMTELKSRSESEKQIEEDGVEIVLGLPKPTMMDQLADENHLLTPLVEMLKESLSSYISAKIAPPTRRFLLLVRRGGLLAAMRRRVTQFGKHAWPSARILSDDAREVVKKARQQAMAQAEKLERRSPRNSCAKVIRSALTLSDRMQREAQDEESRGTNNAGARRANTAPEVWAEERLVLLATLLGMDCYSETVDLMRLGIAMGATPDRRDGLLGIMMIELGVVARSQENEARDGTDFDLFRGIESVYLKAAREVAPRPTPLALGDSSWYEPNIRGEPGEKPGKSEEFEIDGEAVP